MKKIFVFCLCFINYFCFSQDLILNEIVAKNGISYITSDEKSPDWIELKNISNSTINLSEYSLVRKSNPDVVWNLPQQTLDKGELFVLEARDEAFVAQWSSVVDYGDYFSYKIPNYQINSWTTTSFDDLDWPTGKTPIGYGESDIVTSTPNAHSVFIRKTVNVKHIDDIQQAILHMDCDDGFIAYINGIEVARSNMGNNQYNDYATTYTDGVIKDGQIPPSYKINNPSSVFVEGENLLAIQIHNCSATSSDLLAIPIISIGYASTWNDVPAVSKYVSLNTGCSFSLNADEETLYLLKNDKIVDSIEWKNLPIDVSIGKSSIDYNSIYYFDEPTPKLENNTQVYVAKTLEKPKLSEEGKLFKVKFAVNAYTSESKSEIRYTTDGSMPTESSPLWKGEMTISKSTNLKIRSFRTGYLPSEVRTASYVYVSHVPTLPTASITANYDDFFGYTTGIYVEGPYAEVEEPHFGANYWEDWEKAVHLDFFDEEGQCVVSQEVGCKIGGNWSRAQPQKTLKLYARDQYGKDKIDYQFFKDKPISSFHMILLRNSGNDFNNTQMRDGVISELAKEMNIDRQAYQPAVVYINGEYYGIQNVREKQNKHYVAENFGYNKEDIDVVKNGGWGSDELVDGNTSDFMKMREYMERTDLSIPENYETAKKYVDIPNFIDYNVLEMYVVNEDWPGNNIAYWHNRKLNTPWRYLLFDADFGLGIWDLEGKVNKDMLKWCTTVGSDNYATADWSTIILRQLLQNEVFTRDFLNATADRLNTTLSPSHIGEVIDSVYDLISDEMYYHKQKWGDNWQDGWLDQMRQFGQRRADIMRSQTEEFFATNGSYTLSLAISEEKAGKIHLNTIDVSSFPWSGKYFKNNTIFLTAIPNPGFEFVRWEGAVNTTEKSIEITTDQATNVTAIFNYVGNEPNVIISEIYYHTYQEGETEWIEIFNKGTSDINLSNWTITFDRYNQTFTIPEETKMNRYGFLIFANDAQAFCKTHPYIDTTDDRVRVINNFNIDFPKDFATITLRDANGCTIDKAYYSEKSSNAQKADGYGYSCKIIDFDSDEKRWFATARGGMPTYFDDYPESGGIRWPIISEINYASGKTADAGDWIEIYNPNENIGFSLSDWMIKDKNGKISVIYDPILLPAQSYVVFADNPEKFHAIYPNVECYQLDLSLNNYIDAIELYNPFEFLVDKVAYSMFDASWTKSAFETGKTLSLINLLSDNSKGENWQASSGLGTPGKENTFVNAINDTEFIKVEVYPNPCKDFISINLYGDFIYSIISSNGQIVMQGNATSNNKIDIQSLVLGTYLLVIQQNEKKYLSTIVKK